MLTDLYELPAETYEEMMDICRQETRKSISDILGHCLPIADTPEGRVLMEEQLYGVLIQMLTYMQVKSKRLRKEKQREGIDNAIANGVHFGRKRKFIAEDYIDVFKRLENGEITNNAARAEIGASPNTFIKLRRQLKEKGLI